MSSAMFASMVIFFAFSVPIAISIGLASVTGIHFFSTIPMLVAPKEMFSAIDKFALGAIPFFILAGNLMEVGGISNRLVNFAKSMSSSKIVIIHLHLHSSLPLSLIEFLMS